MKTTEWATALSLTKRWASWSANVSCEGNEEHEPPSTVSLCSVPARPAHPAHPLGTNKLELFSYLGRTLSRFLNVPVSKLYSIIYFLSFCCSRSHLSTWLGLCRCHCPGLPAAFYPTGSQNPLCWSAVDRHLRHSRLQTTPGSQKIWLITAECLKKISHTLECDFAYLCDFNPLK